jgi:diadenosine tetraphosphate (Ap4A) HIT family hydrolase
MNIMETIDILGRHWKVECMGCAIAQKEMEVPGGIIKETEHFILHQDPNNAIPGFLIIALKRHISSFANFTEQEMNEFIKLLNEARNALIKIKDIEYCTMIQEEKAQHFHFWILPKYNWMNNIFDGKIENIHRMLKYGKMNWINNEHIRNVLNTVNTLKLIISNNGR